MDFPVIVGIAALGLVAVNAASRSNADSDLTPDQRKALKEKLKRHESEIAEQVEAAASKIDDFEWFEDIPFEERESEEQMQVLREAFDVHLASSVLNWSVLRGDLRIIQEVDPYRRYTFVIEKMTEDGYYDPATQMAHVDGLVIPMPPAVSVTSDVETFVAANAALIAIAEQFSFFL